MVLARVTNLYGFHLIYKNLGKLCLNLFLNIYTLSVIANLAVVADAAVNNPLCSLLQVGVFAHYGRSLSSQL